MYQLYTYPNCEKCEKTKSFLDLEEIAYQEINTALQEGLVEIRKLYSQIKDKIRRDEKGHLLLPILIKRNDSGIEEVVQSLDEIKEYCFDHGVEESLEVMDNMKNLVGRRKKFK